MNRRPCMLSVGIAWSFSFVLPAYAQAPAHRVDAEALAGEAAALVEKGDFARACAKYQASAQLDPGARRFMKLADCQERAGMIAGAWISFGDARDRAEARGDKVLAAAARDNGKRLEAKLARIEIVVPQDNDVGGLQIRRDGTLVVDAVRGVPVPVDPGTHLISATAPGRRPWETKIGLSAGKTTVSVVIPLLDEASDAVALHEPTSDVAALREPALLPAAPPKALSLDEEAAADQLPLRVERRSAAALLDRGPLTTGPASSIDTELDPQRGSTQRTVGWVLGGAGLASAAVGTIFAVRADATRNTLNRMCLGNVCEASARDELDALRTQATLANVFIWGGIASLAGGAVTYFMAPSPQRIERSTSSLQIMPSVAPGAGVLWATGRF